MAAVERHVLLLDLIDDPVLIARYEAWHAAGAVPAAVMRGIRAAGVVAMEIYRRDDRLVMLMDAAPGFDPAAKAAADALDPDVRAWEKLMEGFQKRLRSAGDGEKWVAAKRIFTLDQQP